MLGEGVQGYRERKYIFEICYGFFLSFKRKFVFDFLFVKKVKIW